MNIDNLQQLEKDVDCALSGLHTLILAYGFNVVPMRESAKNLLPDIQIKSLICLAWSMNISQAQTD